MNLEHRVYVNEEDNYWECDCGKSGSGGANLELSSDKHINYERGDTRVDVSSLL